eukprot:Rmarinus@m.10644
MRRYHRSGNWRSWRGFGRRREVLIAMMRCCFMSARVGARMFTGKLRKDCKRSCYCTAHLIRRPMTTFCHRRLTRILSQFLASLLLLCITCRLVRGSLRRKGH